MEDSEVPGEVNGESCPDLTAGFQRAGFQRQMSLIYLANRSTETISTAGRRSSGSSSRGSRGDQVGALPSDTGDLQCLVGPRP